MWMRQAFFQWMIPAAFVLPLWLVVGWIVSGSSPWALLWVLLSAPIVFVLQLIVTLLVRARPTVRGERAVSWRDVAIIGVWHLLIIALGFFVSGWWWLTLTLAVIAGFTAIGTSLAQLWGESSPAPTILRTREGVAYIPADVPGPQATVREDVYIVHEDPPATPR